MKKIASFVSLTLAATALSTGCAVDAMDTAEAEIATTEEAACANPEGTNLMLATLAVAIGTELHRWQIPTDFEIYRGYNYQEMLRVKSSARGRCSNNCQVIDSLLALQDSRNDQKIRFSDGTRLSSWSFAARLTSGYKSQQTCDSRQSNGSPNNCPAELHYLSFQETYPGECQGQQIVMSKFGATKGNSSGGDAGGPLSYPAQLQNKLLWAENGSLNTNPYLKFNVLPSGLDIELDPGQCMTGEPGCVTEGSGSCANLWASSNRLSPVNLTGQCCSYQLTPANGTIPATFFNGSAVKAVGSPLLHYCQ